MLTATPVREIIERQRQFFATGRTKSVDFRIEQLKKLKQAILDHEAEIIAAVQADLRKPHLEAYLTEIGSVSKIDYALKQIKSWVKPQKVATGIEQFPASARVYSEPLGVVLIISPWNYPFNLAIEPLIGAIAAGNCAIVKPSEVSANTSRVIAKLFGAVFDPGYISVVEGDAEVSQGLLAEKFDHIFFTGGTAIGQRVMEAAAKQLTPVTLELGGKSPCIVDPQINLETAATRVTWGKFLNAGQTCIAPDYLLVDRRIQADFVAEIQKKLHQFFGPSPQESPDFGRIVSDKHFQRLASLLQDAQIVTGGELDPGDRYIAPTLVENVALDAPLMQEEIFGPILPIIPYDRFDEAIAIVNQRPKPLALYLFSNDKEKQARIVRETSSGGVCLNDTIMHVGVAELPFGGVGPSGIGAYHGKASFDTFSHRKSVLKKSFWLDLDLRYPPYAGKLKLVKKFLGQ
ncbi:aldehyde dehydrogenase [Oxynema aestuarii]|uniref:Aldehyde dehydrogenase n=1 Tax=Oxynema aestuarii AP17 TaxID=2064643 RepID=A0A6H1TS81_9CYAN|nr:aldehyde dehydrogenase [Oxynema aestuarii]QIZ69401.1 aldehyde dehydrogenase [Oxynema aestuarii AP17]